ncbi:MAG: hypothetical protein ABJN62_15690 [Halioglobus sp.]
MKPMLDNMMIRRLYSAIDAIVQDQWRGKSVQIQIACHESDYQMAMAFAANMRSDTELVEIPVSVKITDSLELSDQEELVITAGSLHILTSREGSLFKSPSADHTMLHFKANQ